MIRFVVTTRRTRFTGLRAAWRLRTTFLPAHGEQDWTVWARAFGTSAICIAPLPMIAPPQVQAQSLARAIRTDIGFSFFPVAGAKRHRPAPPIHLCYDPKGQSFMNAAIVLTAFACPRAGIGTRNQSKSRYLSQNRTDYATILCDWLIFGPKSHRARVFDGPPPGGRIAPEAMPVHRRFTGRRYRQLRRLYRRQRLGIGAPLPELFNSP
ncbi:hypothetical protein [Sphingopyxis sp.]|uniref:hypothetical protein n=1 Tax=Sphingopyxis sp. TaxID=1908224 RepID=UPI002B46D701|nr:hypothetical protein [Sphingopyxis sp.]HJS10559.1 hypothetical protein [Sphingopyxis sp.]